MQIRMFNMGYGESILLTNETECLLVDCGSESPSKHAYFKTVLGAIKEEQNKKRTVMISHFHNDHINGLVEIAKDSSAKFDIIYIPYIFTLEHPNTLDMIIIRHLLENKVCPADKTLSIMDLLIKLSKHNPRIVPLNRGSSFEACGDEYSVLWPVPEKLVSKRLYNHIVKKLDEGFINQIERISDNISFLFLDRQELHCESILPVFENGIGLIQELEFQSQEQKLFQMNVEDIKTILKSLHENENKASIVCQSNGSHSVLLTGDVPANIMKRIALNDYSPGINLRSCFDVIKAPHHGTNNHYFSFGSYSTYRRIMISNGETNMKSRGKISANYNLCERTYCVLCPNNSSCEIWSSSVIGSCCNTGDVCDRPVEILL